MTWHLFQSGERTRHMWNRMKASLRCGSLGSLIARGISIMVAGLAVTCLLGAVVSIAGSLSSLPGVMDCCLSDGGYCGGNSKIPKDILCSSGLLSISTAISLLLPSLLMFSFAWGIWIGRRWAYYNSLGFFLALWVLSTWCHYYWATREISDLIKFSAHMLFLSCLFFYSGFVAHCGLKFVPLTTRLKMTLLYIAFYLTVGIALIYLWVQSDEMSSQLLTYCQASN